MKKILTSLLFIGLAMGFLGMEVTGASECTGTTANDLGKFYSDMAYYLDIVQEPMTFDWHKVQRWDDLKKLCAKATQEGLPDSCTLIVSDFTKERGVKAITFGELKALLPKWAAIMDAPDGEEKITALKKNKNQAEDEKAFGEFYKALKGDKLAQFKDCKNCNWYTTGKRHMTAAKEFQNASLWCTESWSDEGTGRWKVECHRFNGYKRINTWTKSGTGSRTSPEWVYR